MNDYSISDRDFDRLLHALEKLTGVPAEQVIMGGRAPRVMRARRALYVVLSDMGCSSVEIGRMVGGRDHTTVLSGIKRATTDVRALAAAVSDVSTSAPDTVAEVDRLRDVLALIHVDARRLVELSAGMPLNRSVAQAIAERCGRENV